MKRTCLGEKKTRWLSFSINLILEPNLSSLSRDSGLGILYQGAYCFRDLLVLVDMKALYYEAKSLLGVRVPLLDD